MTFRSSIFRKFLAGSFLLISVTILGLDFYLGRSTAQRQVESIQQKLEGQARVLAGEIESVAPGDLAQWSQGAGARAGARVTVIDPRGVVRGDSEHDIESMENHSDRPEILEARRAKMGTSIRHSQTLDRDLCYVAILVDYHGQPDYVLRLALPIENLDAAIAVVRWQILEASLAAAIAAFLIAYYFSFVFSRRVNRLRAFAEGLAGAQFANDPLPREDDELGALGQSLNRTSTQLHEMVNRLSLESSRRESILASMMEGVLAVDDEMRVTFCNQSFSRAVGCQFPVPERVPLLELVREPELLDVLKQVLASGQSVKQRLELSGPSNRSLEIQAAPLGSTSRPGVIAILHDITDLERLERVRKDFVANVSHELRTPLTAIRGYAETLLDGALEDQENNRRFLEIIKAHAIRLNNISADLLVLSELESRKPQAEPDRLSVPAVLESALRTVEAEARIRGIRLHCEKLDEVEVMGDRMRLEQVLVNLLDNAVKFNRRGGEVRVAIEKTGDGQAQIVIADTGDGIPSEEVPRIFERFYRVDKTRSRAVGGTGLGLSIVKHVVERMHGTIRVESAMGKGSRFIVQFSAV
jgi:two-component system, OmpR family, phosphate regulon sensor histidine kinase PhoR